jgi:glucose-6-phosphate 1-dehydrogenase
MANGSEIPTSIIIFGASGDLTGRKLIPSIYNLYRKKRLPERISIFGFSITEWSSEDFRRDITQRAKTLAGIDVSTSEWQHFVGLLNYQTGDFHDPAAYQQLSAALEKIEDGPANRLYYLATIPRFFGEIVTQLSHADMTHETDGWRRVIIEKPFGTNLATAQALNKTLHKALHENQVYRIDHYLGKETVQNIMVLRFANIMFEPIWNRNYIDNVQITVAEDVGVEHRAEYYERAGVVRDMFQNHLLQLLTLVAMEPPSSLNADALRNEKVKVLSALRPICPDDVAKYTVRGQYEGYRKEPGVAPDSTVATYAAMQLFIDNWRWQGIPFYLRSGKCLTAQSSEIVIEFKSPPHLMFPMPRDSGMTPNLIAMCLHPDEGIHQRFEAKVPDTVTETRSVEMEFHYKNSFGPSSIPEAYERLLLDAIIGDPAHFIRNDQIEMAWEFIDPILEGWQSPYAPPLAFYKPGSWGPAEADEFLACEDCEWHPTCIDHK